MLFPYSVLTHNLQRTAVPSLSHQFNAPKMGEIEKSSWHRACPEELIQANQDLQLEAWFALNT